jgi:hypothetical protein
MQTKSMITERSATFTLFPHPAYAKLPDEVKAAATRIYDASG